MSINTFCILSLGTDKINLRKDKCEFRVGKKKLPNNFDECFLWIVPCKHMKKRVWEGHVECRDAAKICILKGNWILDSYKHCVFKDPTQIVIIVITREMPWSSVQGLEHEKRFIDVISKHAFENISEYNL